MWLMQPEDEEAMENSAGQDHTALLSDCSVSLESIPILRTCMVHKIPKYLDT